MTIRSRCLLQLCALATLAVSASTCGSPPPASAQDEAGMVSAARKAQNEAIASRDLDRMASYWTDSVTITAGLGSTIRGKAAYRRAFEQDSAIVYERTPEQVTVSATWPLAWEQGKWTGRAAGTTTPVISGNYAAQWVKANGRWLIRSELYVAARCQGVACRWPAEQP